MGGNGREGRNGILQVMAILEERKAMSRYENQSRKKKREKKEGKGKERERKMREGICRKQWEVQWWTDSLVAEKKG